MATARGMARLMAAVLLGLGAACMLIYAVDVSGIHTSVDHVGRRLSYGQYGRYDQYGRPQTETSPAVRYLPGILLNGLIVGLFAFFYKSKVIGQLPHIEAAYVQHKETNEAFRHGLFDCFGDCNVCLYHACCVPVAAAKNMEVTGVMQFWPGCLVVWLSYTFGSMICCMGPIIRTYLFSQVKQKIKVEDNIVTDCCCQLFCGPCNTAQESMEVDDLLGVEIGCINVEFSKGSSEGLV
eukprot:TRINITY_DN7090_c0_g1_i1.p1 TRINITY_DN7090_c0_g1~~TRINITY_DN7090_c0_g1_i1.p1  ORF type:complete len:237 (-),score=25.41 TRINITY_DN7090_c0_g1_i1:136-846(-)